MMGLVLLSQEEFFNTGLIVRALDLTAAASRLAHDKTDQTISAP